MHNSAMVILRRGALAESFSKARLASPRSKTVCAIMHTQVGFGGRLCALGSKPAVASRLVSIKWQKLKAGPRM